MPLPVRGSTIPGTALAVALLAAACGSLARLDPSGAPSSELAGSGVDTSSARPAGPTIVSLTFDDGFASAFEARPLLAAHDMHATFFVNSGHLDQQRFMTWQQVQALESDGNEIGGHTALHVNLPLVERAEAERQICNDRVVLLEHGHDITTLAYPFGASDPTVEALAEKCGYNSARTTSHLRTAAEPIPPARPYAISIGNDATPMLAEIQGAITRAASAGGGWVPILFHGICDGCSEMAISAADFASLLDWLDGQQAGDIVVRTAGEVIGGEVQPGVDGPAAPAPPNGTNGLANASLEDDVDGDGEPDCWRSYSPNADAATWTTTTVAHDGTAALHGQVTGQLDGDARFSVHEDLGQCTPSVLPGHRYRITAWYRSTVPVWFTTHTRERTTFSFGTKSQTFPAATDWTEVTWITPEVPRNVDGLSFGISIADEGSLTIDDLRFDDAAASD